MARPFRTRTALALLIATAGCLAGAQPAAAAPPETTITAGPADNSLTNDNTQTFEFTASQPSTFACSLDEGESLVTVACTSPYTPTLRDGGRTFRVTATNAGGEADPTPAQRVFTIDTTPPQTTIIEGPPEGAVINNDAPFFGWSSSEDGSTFACIADGVALSSCTQAFLTGASDGPHSFSVVATDRAGNTDPTPATRRFTVKLQDVPQGGSGGSGGSGGQSGSVTRTCQRLGNVITGTNNADTLSGTPGSDTIFGLGGNDTLRGGLGADCLAGQAGSDRLFGSLGNDIVLGGSGNDRIGGEKGNDVLRGEVGNDRITGSAGNDALYGDAGADHLSDFRGRDNFSGGAGNDLIEARDGTRFGQLVPDTVRCGRGRDIAVVDRRDRVARDCERVRRR